MSKPSLILIDEPELNLHPALQARFLASLAKRSEDQVMFATHSIGLARTMADAIYSFDKSGAAAVVRRFEDTPNYSAFLRDMSFSAFKELGFRKLLLVEGVNEVKTVQQWLRALGKDGKVVCLPLGGAALINAGRGLELGEFTRVANDVAVLIDSERDGAEVELVGALKAFQKTCEDLGFQCHVTERRAIENYLPERAIRAVKGEKYRALGAYELLTAANPCWGKHETWKIALEMTKEEVLDTDVGNFLNGLTG